MGHAQHVRPALRFPHVSYSLVIASSTLPFRLELYFWGAAGSGALPPTLSETEPNFRIVRWPVGANSYMHGAEPWPDRQAGGKGGPGPAEGKGGPPPHESRETREARQAAKRAGPTDTEKQNRRPTKPRARAAHDAAEARRIKLGIQQQKTEL